jgi:hypothetical protein
LRTAHTRGGERQKPLEMALERYVYGHHGTTKTEAEAIRQGRFDLDPSERTPPIKKWRWLGKGIYFFQDGRMLAGDWAKERVADTSLEPAVLEARIDLENCLDLLDTDAVELLKSAYASLERHKILNQEPFTIRGGEVKVRKRKDSTRWKNHGANFLDFLVIETAISGLAENGTNIESVRSVFIEGKTIYENSWLFDKSHVAIAVRRPYGRMEPIEILSI